MSSVSQEIGRVLDAAATALRNGASIEEIAALMYDESVIVVSEGASSAARGLNEALPRMAEFMRQWGPRPRATFQVCEPVLSADSLAIAMIKAEIRPDTDGTPALQYSAFTGWKRVGGRWVVAMEMVCSGLI
jgi:hypothetical protein